MSLATWDLGLLYDEFLLSRPLPFTVLSSIDDHKSAPDVCAVRIFP